MSMMCYAWVPLQYMLEHMAWVAIPAEEKVRINVCSCQNVFLMSHIVDVSLVTAVPAGSCGAGCGALLEGPGVCRYGVSHMN